MKRDPENDSSAADRAPEAWKCEQSLFWLVSELGGPKEPRNFHSKDGLDPEAATVELRIAYRREGPELIVRARLYYSNDAEPLSELGLRVSEDDPLAIDWLNRRIFPWILSELGEGEADA